MQNSECFFSKTYDFINTFITKQCGKSENTKRTYKFSLSTFYDYITNHLKLSPLTFLFSDFTYDFFMDYIKYLQTKNNKNTTINLKISALKTYVEYASNTDPSILSVYIQISRIPLLSIEKKVREVISNEDLSIIFNSTNNTYFGIRDRFILILLFDSAIRVGEIIKIKLGDITKNKTNYSILIKGKGKKERRIILSDKCSLHLENYLQKCHIDINNPEAPLFFTKIKGYISHMSERNIERIVKKYGILANEKSANIESSVHPHMLRRSRATSLYRQGVPIEQISLLLGHSNIETTRNYYASPSNEQLKQTVEKGSKIIPATEKLWIENIDDIKRKFGLI